MIPFTFSKIVLLIFLTLTVVLVYAFQAYMTDFFITSQAREVLENISQTAEIISLSPTLNDLTVRKLPYAFEVGFVRKRYRLVAEVRERTLVLGAFYGKTPIAFTSTLFPEDYEVRVCGGNGCGTRYEVDPYEEGTVAIVKGAKAGKYYICVVFCNDQKPLGECFKQLEVRKECGLS